MALPAPADLIRLFGSNTWQQSERLHPEEVNASAVNLAAGALLSLRGKPEEQMALVRSLSPETAAALCRWLGDPAFWVAVAQVTKH